MNPKIHKLVYPKYANIINSSRHDPVTKESFREGQEVIACAKCKSIFDLNSWKYINETHCKQKETLVDILDLENPPDFILGMKSFDTFSNLLRYVYKNYDYWIYIYNELQKDDTLSVYSYILSESDINLIKESKHSDTSLHLYTMCQKSCVGIDTFTLFGQVIDLQSMSKLLKKTKKDNREKEVVSLILNGKIQEYYNIFLHETNSNNNLLEIFNRINVYIVNNEQTVNMDRKILQYFYFVENTKEYILPYDFGKVFNIKNFSLIDNIYTFYTKKEITQLNKIVGFDIKQKLEKMPYSDYVHTRKLYYLNEKYVPSDFMTALKKDFSKNISLIENFPRKRSLRNYLKRCQFNDMEVAEYLDTLKNSNMKALNKDMNSIKLSIKNKNKERIKKQKSLKIERSQVGNLKQILSSKSNNKSNKLKSKHDTKNIYPPEPVQQNYGKLIIMILFVLVFLFFLEKIMPETLRETIYNFIQPIIRLFHV